MALNNEKIAKAANDALANFNQLTALVDAGLINTEQKDTILSDLKKKLRKDLDL